MALVRILVDGYSLLHSWPELAPGEARHSAAARDELVHHLQLYSDAVGYHGFVGTRLGSHIWLTGNIVCRADECHPFAG